MAIVLTEALCDGTDIEVPKKIAPCRLTYLNAMTWFTIMALIRTMSCKRFVRAVAENSRPPDVLLHSLSKAMDIARDISLPVPATLQARATKHMHQQT